RRSAAREANPGLASASPFVSTIANLGNQAALGAPAAAVSAALAPLTAMNRGVGLGEAFQLNRNLSNLALGANPTAQTVGTLGAFLNPSSPASRVAQAGFRAAGGARLAQAAASAPTLGQAAIAQL